MKTVIAKSVVYVEGYPWGGGLGNTTYTVPKQDIDKCRDEKGNITGESVKKYIEGRWSDFDGLTYVRASIEVPNGKGLTDTVEAEWGEKDENAVWDDDQ